MARGLRFEVELQGLDVLRRRLDSRRLLGPVRSEMIAEAVKQGEKVADEKSKGRAGTGQLANAIKGFIEDGGNRGRIAVPRAVATRALRIEEGRPPGKAPGTYKQLTRWARRAGVPFDRKSIRELRNHLRERGTRPIGFMKAAAEEAEATLKRQRGPTEQAIEKEWERG